MKCARRYKKKTILEIIDEIDSQKVYLPAIQRRNYMWGEDKIISLMDSIMREYPFGTFLFWEIKRKTVNDKGYSMYEFIKDYHETDSYRNELTGLPFSIDEANEDDTILAVLDGQQRLTSLYIALKGSISIELPGKHRSNENAFPRKELYFNLLSKKSDDNDEIVYSFSFMPENEVPEDSDECIWYKVKDIVQHPDAVSLNRYIFSTQWRHNETVTDNIVLLYQRIKIDEIINYYEYPSDSIDDVLNVYARVNS